MSLSLLFDLHHTLGECLHNICCWRHFNLQKSDIKTKNMNYKNIILRNIFNYKIVIKLFSFRLYNGTIQFRKSTLLSPRTPLIKDNSENSQNNSIREKWAKREKFISNLTHRQWLKSLALNIQNGWYFFSLNMILVYTTLVHATRRSFFRCFFSSYKPLSNQKELPNLNANIFLPPKHRITKQKKLSFDR